MKQVALTYENHTRQLVQTFTDLLRSKSLTDVTIICDDKIKIYAHKLILCAGSSFFKEFFLTNAKSNERPLLYLKGIQQQFLLPWIQYMYNGEVTIPENNLDDVLEVAKDLEILGMQELDGNISIKEEITPTKFRSTTTTASDKNAISCEECEYIGFSKWNLQRHMKTIHGLNDIEFGCSQCKFQSTSALTLRVHMESLHGSTELKAICSICRREMMANTATFARHINSKHSLVKETFHCDDENCTFKSNRKDDLKRHFDRKHGSGGKYVCNICEFRSMRPGSLRIHIEKEHSSQF